MVRRLLLVLCTCVLASTLAVASPAGPASADTTNDGILATSPLVANIDGANRATINGAYQRLLGRNPTQNELSRFLSLLRLTMTERSVFVQIMGTREFYLHSGGTVRSFVNEFYEVTEGRRATQYELRTGIRTYRKSEGPNRFRRRAVAEQVLDVLDFDVDGLRLKRMNVRRSPTGFVEHVNLILNTTVRADDTDVTAIIDGVPIVGVVEYLQNGRHLRLRPNDPLLTTGNVITVVTEGTRRADGTTFLPALRNSLFPHIRVVAYYGNHQSRLMGVLGETGPENAALRVRAAAARFDQPNRPAVGAFEMIATVAQRSAGADGNYSHPSQLADLQYWIDVARDEGMYVILDIQPGQSDFYTESVRYESLLMQPHVGLALDPEWRMQPGQRPGQLVGSVTAAEINGVSKWLSDLVVEHNLPDKIFVLHQFQSRMIRNRQDVVDRPGLETIIHADGFGGRAIKLETYSIIQASPPFWNGFKLFIDEDTRIFQPGEVLSFATVPVPDLISYQ